MEKTTLHVLVGDDQPDVREALKFLLKAAGHSVLAVDSPERVVEAAAAQRFDAVLIDLNYTRDTTSGFEGLDLVARLRAASLNTPVIVMTAWSTVPLAVEAMRRGATDFVEKPWTNADLLSKLETHASQTRRSNSDVEVARQVQRNLLPQRAKTLATIDYAAGYRPLSAIGGDYYDFLDLGPGRVGFVLADVAGKGISGALLMANLQGIFRANPDEAPTSLLERANRAIVESTAPEHYVTAFYGCYDDATGRLDYVNCGHNPALLLRASGQVERLESTSVPLGMFAAWECNTAAVVLGCGDTLLIYSDGVVEAGLDQGRELGEGALIATARLSCDPKALAGRILGAAHAAGPNDDMTVIAIRVRG